MAIHIKFEQEQRNDAIRFMKHLIVKQIRFRCDFDGGSEGEIWIVMDKTPSWFEVFTKRFKDFSNPVVFRREENF